MDDLTLFTDGLLSKHGFSDGDILGEFFEDEFECLHIPNDTEHKALIALVRNYVLPVLTVKVEVEEIGTSHNPIRATSINGVPYNCAWTGSGLYPGLGLHPSSVIIPRDVVREALALACFEDGVFI